VNETQAWAGGSSTDAVDDGPVGDERPVADIDAAGLDRCRECNGDVLHYELDGAGVRTAYPCEHVVIEDTGGDRGD
jgi:hypothetical protein